MSISAFPHGVIAALDRGPNLDTLTLNTLSSFDSDPASPYDSTAGIRILTNGDVEEIISDSWTAQNSGVEWIDGFTSRNPEDYEANWSSVTGSGGTLTGPDTDTWHVIDSTLQWTLSSTVVGSAARTGTLTIREIADTSNSVSALASLTCENEL